MASPLSSPPPIGERPPAPVLEHVPFPPPTYVAGFHDEAAVRAMPYRRLGASGRVVSALSYGASALGGVFGTPGGADEARALVHAAVRSGINLIDVAPWYGHGKAEQALGDALQGVPRQAYYLTTKCVYECSSSQLVAWSGSPRVDQLRMSH